VPYDTVGLPDAAMPSRRAVGLPEQGFVFCSFNNSHKVTPVIFDLWMRLLQAVEGSVLWLLADNPGISDALRQEAAKRGVAADRLVFAPRLDRAAHLARHALADLMLDTLPYNAHTTAIDALWCGLPVLTCPGASFAARVAGSLLTAAGLPELVVPTLADYEALALRLAREPGQLAALKARAGALRRGSALFDMARYCRQLEAAFETMWARSQRGEAPAGFAVAPA
jgi:predicted O-linked N-acetylglucosamine transferase (SPINDLY family)